VLNRWAKSHPDVFTCCEWGLQISAVYNGGAAFLTFLAKEFGEDIHPKLLRDDAASFPAAFERETKPYTLPQVFERVSRLGAEVTHPRQIVQTSYRLTSCLGPAQLQ
jgi:hypothetical protein